MKKYFRHKIENLIVVTKIVTVHYFEFDKNFATQGEAHDFWELVYADKESIVCTADGKELPVEQGEMLFHKPNEFHALSANKRKAPNVFIVSFECKSEAMRFFENRKIKLDPSFGKYVYAIVEEAKKTFDMPFSDPNIKKLPLRRSPTLGGQQLIKNNLEILLINIMRSLTETERGNRTFLQEQEFGNKLVKDTIRYLENHVDATLHINDVCAAVCYCRAHVFREFRKATGQGVMEYFTACKIERAKQLLREHDRSIKQIAESLAFDSPNYFSKTFKKLTGMTPSLYKKSIAFL